ncbi:MAG: LacI family DNA-binding transcriptional regulator [Lentisphaeria bacterium]|nr:LacI family DNA-binding transcriptional regulator [Lentisphaeria bacterium]
MNTRITLKDIALMAGVSKTVVSKVLSNDRNFSVAGKTRLRILELVKTHNYVPRASARSLACGRSRQLGFFLSSATTMGLTNLHFGQILSGMVKACADHDYGCVVNAYDFSQLDSLLAERNLLSRNIDGCVLCGFCSREQLEQISRFQIPTVLIGAENFNQHIPCLYGKPESIYREVFDFFEAQGHYDVWLGKPESYDYRVAREIAVERPHFKVRILDRTGEDEFAYGVHYAKEFLSMPTKERPTMLWASDHFAMSFLREIFRAGLKCPDDISVLAEDTQLTEWYNPPLSVTKAYNYELGVAGVSLLVEWLEKNLSFAEARELAEKYCFTKPVINRESIKKLK